jgi:hypothetical protein
MGTATVGRVSATTTSGSVQAGRDPDQLKSTLLTAGAIAAAAAAYVTSAASGDAEGRTHTVLLVVGAVLAGTTVLLGALQQRRTQRRLATAEQVAVEAEAELMLTLNGALAPITNYLGDMADQRTRAGRATVAGQLSQAVVDAAVRLTADGSRSAFYQLDDDWQELTREVWGGRSSQPRSAFVAGTPDGDAVLDVVRAGDYVVIDDTTWSSTTSRRARWWSRRPAPATAPWLRSRSRRGRCRWVCSPWTRRGSATSARSRSSCSGCWRTCWVPGWRRYEPWNERWHERWNERPHGRGYQCGDERGYECRGRRKGRALGGVDKRREPPPPTA